MHPHWKALSKCIIRHQPFVTPKSSSENERGPSESKSLQKEDSLLSGKETARFYEEIIKTPLTSTITPPKLPTIVITSNASNVNLNANYSYNQICQAVMEQNTSAMEVILKDRPNFLNQCDQYGWSLLMMAACDGLVTSFKYLLDAGADLFTVTKSELSAYTLAKKKGHNKILALITEYVITTYSNETCTDIIKTQTPFYCELCRENFKESSLKNHQTSTLHQFNIEHHPFPMRFGINENNKGFQLMIKQGWNRNSGLGPEQNGHIYPVKTQLRDFRTGFGVEQKKESRITHFKPNDALAIKRYPHPKPYTRRDRICDLARDRRKERVIRNELS